jgi:hypothetical protein
VAPHVGRNATSGRPAGAETCENANGGADLACVPGGVFTRMEQQSEYCRRIAGASDGAGVGHGRRLRRAELPKPTIDCRTQSVEEFRRSHFRSVVLLVRECVALFFGKSLATSVGQQPLQAARHVSEVESDRGSTADAGPDLRLCQLARESFYIFKSLQQSVSNGLEWHGDPGNRAAEPHLRLSWRCSHAMLGVLECVLVPGTGPLTREGRCGR